MSRRASLELLIGSLGCGVLPSGCSMFLKKGWDSRRAEARDFSDEEMAWLRRTTTVFLLRAADMSRRDEFEEALERVWHLTEIEVAPYEHLRQYTDTTKYSYLVIEGETFASYPVCVYYLTLFVLPPGDDEERDDIGYCRIDLHATLPTLQLTLQTGANADTMAEVYRQGEFHNWSPGFLAIYLQSIQADLERGHRRKELESLEDTEHLQRLREATLYVPDHLLFEYGPDADTSKRLAPPRAPERVPLQPRDHHPRRPRRSHPPDRHDKPTPLHLDYVLSAAAKIVSIYEYGRGTIYRDVSPMRTALGSGDFDVF